MVGTEKVSLPVTLSFWLPLIFNLYWVLKTKLSACTAVAKLNDLAMVTIESLWGNMVGKILLNLSKVSPSGRITFLK
jgi:hypothetical protein